MQARTEGAGARGEFFFVRRRFFFFLFRIGRCLDSPFSVKIQARCAGMSLVWLHVSYLCAPTKEASFSTVIAPRADFPFSGGVQRKV